MFLAHLHNSILGLSYFPDSGEHFIIILIQCLTVWRRPRQATEASRSSGRASCGLGARACRPNDVETVEYSVILRIADSLFPGYEDW